MNDIQQKEFEILKQFDACCKELGIKYFLCGGSMLGAVRHKGFIPWDDDIDVGMSRDNYEKFIREAQSWLNKRNLFLQHITTEKTTPFGYAKVRLNGTKFVEYCNRNVKAHQGVYIDIFPYDYAPESPQDQRRQYRTVSFWYKLFSLHQIPDITQKPQDLKLAVKYVIRRLIHYAVRVVSVEFIFRKLKEATTENNNNTTSGFCSCWLVPEMKIYNVRTMTEAVQLEFEGIKFPVPSNYDETLTEEYGDYMTIPPENERITHSPYILSLGE